MRSSCHLNCVCCERQHRRCSSIFHHAFANPHILMQKDWLEGSGLGLASGILLQSVVITSFVNADICRLIQDKTLVFD